MWIFWALLSAILVATRRSFEKQLMNQPHPFTYGFLVQSVSLPVLAALTTVNDKLLNPLHLGVQFWLPLLAISALFPALNSYLYTKAMKDSELSNVLPLQSLWPVFSLLLAWATIGEVPSVIATLGVGLTVLGVYALGLKGKGLHHPLQPFRDDGSSRAMLLSVLLVAVAGIVEKVAVKASNPLFYSFASSFCAVISLHVAMKVRGQKIPASLKPVAKQVGRVGILQSTSYVTYLLAIAAGPIAYVSALRSTNILLGSVLGIVFFKEKLSRAKIVSLAFIITGALFLTFG